MAQSYDRRINLYINIDGKEVKNNVKSIRGELSHLVNAQNQMTIGSEEYRKQTLKIQQLKTVLKGHAEAVGQIQTPLQKVIGFAKGLLPAFGFAALAAGAKYAFDKITSGTDAMADKFEFAMAGMKNGTDYFWKTLASGEWSNFFSNFREAVKVGYEYSKMLDTVEDQTRGLSMIESDARREELRLEEAVKNKLLSKDERIKAGEARIQLEEDLSAKRTKIATEELDADMLIASQRTGLTREQLIQITKDIDSETKVRAEAYNEQVDQYNKLKKQNVSSFSYSITGAASTIQLPDSKEMINLKKEFDSAPSDVKSYAATLNQYGNLTKDMMDKIASSYNKKNAAEDSAVENTKKVRNLVHTLMAGQDAEGQKLTSNATKEDLDNTTNALDLGYKQQLLLLKQRYDSEETLQKEYKARMLAAEIAYMQTKMQLTGDEEAKIDLQSQLIDKQREYTAALKETVPEILNTDNGIQKLNTRLLEESKLLAFAAQKQAEGTAAQEDATAKQKQQSDAIKMVGDVMTDYVTGALNGSIDGFQSFGDTLILMSLQILKQMVPIWSAQILGLSLASPESVASWGVAGMAKFTVITGLMYAGIAAVEGLVKGGMKNKQDSATKYASGGYTHGETYIAGEAGTEFVAPNWMIKNPLSGPIIAGLESWRRNPITVSQAAIQASNSFSGSTRNAAQNNPTQQSEPVAFRTATDQELKKVLEENTKAIRDFIKWRPAIDVETYERKRENWQKMTQSGLKT